jgi:thiosulfate dehydrogenase [quinone] large subunit
MKTEKFNNVQISALVILRILIGWHFLYEGLAKIMKSGWSAAGFLTQSKGLFSPLFQWMAANSQVLSVVDFLNIWGLTLIGLGLMLGALTRYAAWAGMGLILLYYLCNPPFPGLYYAIPSEGNYLFVNKNLVEMAALWVIAVIPTGQYLGFDRLLFKLLKKQRTV